MARRAHRVVETDEGKFHVTLTRNSVQVRPFYSRKRPSPIPLDEIVEIAKGLKPEPKPETVDDRQLAFLP